MRKSLALAALTAASAALPAQAAFHLWSVSQIYSDSSGNLQYIELTDSPINDPFGSQNFVGGQSITVFNVGASQSHLFTIPSNVSGQTLNHDLLFGTAGLHAAGGPTPDFIIPNNFLFTGGGSISFFGVNGGGSYPALPTDGIHAQVFGDGVIVNNPQNFAGQTGMVVVPEPETAALLLLGGLLVAGVRRAAKV